VTEHSLPFPDVSQGIGYIFGETNAKGQPRPFAPKLLAGNPQLLLDVGGSCLLTHSCYSVAQSYGELLPDELAAEIAIDRLRLRCGGLDLSRVAYVVVVHRHLHRIDTHTLAVPLDLVSGRSLPIFPRDRLACELFKLTRRSTNLLNGLSDPDDPWRRRVTHLMPSNISFTTEVWFRATDDQLGDWLRAGLIRTRSEIIDYMISAGAQLVGAYHHKIIIRHDDDVIALHGGKYSCGFPFARVSGCANKAPVRDPDETRREIADLDATINEMGPRYAKRFVRFGRNCGLEFTKKSSFRLWLYFTEGAPGVSPYPAQHEPKRRVRAGQKLDDHSAPEPATPSPAGTRETNDPIGLPGGLHAPPPPADQPGGQTSKPACVPGAPADSVPAFQEPDTHAMPHPVATEAGAGPGPNTGAVAKPRGEPSKSGAEANLDGDPDSATSLDYPDHLSLFHTYEDELIKHRLIARAAATQLDVALRGVARYLQERTRRILGNLAAFGKPCDSLDHHRAEARNRGADLCDAVHHLAVAVQASSQSRGRPVTLIAQFGPTGPGPVRDEPNRRMMEGGP